MENYVMPVLVYGAESWILSSTYSSLIQKLEFIQTELVSLCSVTAVSLPMLFSGNCLSDQLHLRNYLLPAIPLNPLPTNDAPMRHGLSISLWEFIWVI